MEHNCAKCGSPKESTIHQTDSTNIEIRLGAHAFEELHGGLGIARFYASEVSQSVEESRVHQPRVGKPKRLTAYEFAGIMGNHAGANPGGGCTFGMNKAATIQALRDLADHLEQEPGHIFMAAGVTTEARTDEYPVSTLVLEFHEREGV